MFPRSLAIACVALAGASGIACSAAPDGGDADASEASASQDDGAFTRATLPPGNFVLHVADVGTGLALMVEGADFTLVYDGGSNDDSNIGTSNRFLSYLHAVKPGLSKVDHLVVSHPHRDHVEMLPDVVKSFHVQNVWDSGALNDICGYRKLIDAISRSPGLRYHSGKYDEGPHDIDFGRELCSFPRLAPVHTADRPVESVPIALGQGATMTFLHVDATGHGDDFNENSMVVRLDLDGTRVLLMGDAEAGEREDPSVPPKPRSVEGYLLANHHADLDSDVLVVGHHGSKTSSRKAFLDAVTPAISIISTGPLTYSGVGFPDPEVVTELESRGEVLRTDLDDVSCRANGAKVGRDADGKPGGCSNVQVHIAHGTARAAYAHITD